MEYKIIKCTLSVILYSASVCSEQDLSCTDILLRFRRPFFLVFTESFTMLMTVVVMENKTQTVAGKPIVKTVP